jgi:hypothetical protein
MGRDFYSFPYRVTEFIKVPKVKNKSKQTNAYPTNYS